MKLKNAMIKYIMAHICCLNITLAARLIGFIGVILSSILLSILIQNKTTNNYNLSRSTVLALGIDWGHVHPVVNTTHHADSEGLVISTVVLGYSGAYLIISLCLIFATIKQNRLLTIPWILGEAFSCISKVATLFIHTALHKEKYNRSFIIGSAFYIGIVSWWWIVVCFAQYSWKVKSDPDSIILNYVCNAVSAAENNTPSVNTTYLVKSPKYSRVV